MAQTRLISDLVELVTPNNSDVFVVVDNTTNPSLSVTKKITYASLKESLQDMIDLLVSGGTGINASYSDGSNTLTLTVVADTTIQKGIVSSGGTQIGTRREVNFIPGASITLSGSDNAGSNRVDLRINTTAVSDASSLSASGTSYDVLSSLDTLGDGTKRTTFRTLKAASTKAVLAFADGSNSITFDIDPSQIDINSLSITSPLGLSQGGTAATTAAGARASLGAAKNGVNSDITALSGLTTALSISQGGTAGATAQAALKNLGGLKYVTSVATVGESLLVNDNVLVSNEYRGEFKGVKAASSKVNVSTVANDIAIDVNADNVLNAASANVDLNSYRITNVGAPVSASDVATKAYTDSVAQGLTVKEAVIVATTSGLAGTYVASGFTFTLTATGTPAIDSVAITATGTRVLFKDQATGSQNGIYTLTTSGNIGISPVFTRAADYNTSAEVDAGSFCFVITGATNGGKQFVQTVDNPTLDSTALIFTTLVDTTIAAGSIDNTKLANMDALHVKGTLVSGVPQDLNADNVVTIINSGATTQINQARVTLTGTIDGNARVAVAYTGSTVGTRRRINFIPGSNVTITVADDAGNEEVDVTIASTSSAGISLGLAVALG